MIEAAFRGRGLETATTSGHRSPHSLEAHSLVREMEARNLVLDSCAQEYAEDEFQLDPPMSTCQCHLRRRQYQEGSVLCYFREQQERCNAHSESSHLPPCRSQRVPAPLLFRTATLTRCLHLQSLR